MAEVFGFFDAQNLGTPENPSWDRAYLAELFARYFHLFISDGVFSGSTTAPDQLLVQEQLGYNITLTQGFAFIRGYWYENESPLTLTLEPTDGQYQRIDRIIIRWDKANRSIHSMVLKGTPSIIASPPDLIRSDDYFDLSLAQITIGRTTTAITQANITPEILNPQVCGLVTSLIHQVDTSFIYQQIENDLKNYRENYQGEWETWAQSSRDVFDAWFVTIHDILNKNVAATLLSYIQRQTYSAIAVIGEGGILDITSTKGQEGDMYEVFFEMPGGTREPGPTIQVDGVRIFLKDSFHEDMELEISPGAPVTLLVKGTSAYMMGGGGGLPEYTHVKKTPQNVHILTGSPALTFQVHIAFPVNTGDTWNVNGQQVIMTSMLEDSVLNVPLNVTERLIITRTSKTSSTATVIGMYNVTNDVMVNSTTILATSASVYKAHSLAMPKEGGRFTGVAYAENVNRDLNCIRNISIQSATGNVVASSYLIFRR